MGKAVFSRLGSGENPHYSIEVVDDTQQYRVAVNVQSDDHSKVQYIVFPHWDHPIKDHIQKLPFGLHSITKKRGCLLWITYVLILQDPSHLFLFP